MNRIYKVLMVFSTVLFTVSAVYAQKTLRGEILDAANGDPLIGATAIVKGSISGTTSDWDGSFELEITQEFPVELEFSYIGYASKTLIIENNKRISISLEEDAVVIEGVEVIANRISDKHKESPLTVEAMDLIAIKETPAADFYDGLGTLKGVDLTAASLGFKVINTRGFNSTSPVRSLQIIDGVDNQAPGLNFSLGNFLGTSELDINKVELVVGASSAFYGPNAFNGVISMETRDPFYHDGLSAMVKAGERNMIKTAVRWAQVLKNKKDEKFFAYKFNLEYLRADDWVADNYEAVDGSRVGSDNPGGFDAVNIYGDEYQTTNDFSSFSISQYPGLGIWSRTGYKEEDLVDYNTRNLKANFGLHFRLNPSKEEQSTEFVIKTSFGSGTTVYQGDNRFSLKNITFLQPVIEFKKRNTFFLRAYRTSTGAGDSYDPYFTALRLQERAKSNADWSKDYINYWLTEIRPLINETDFPEGQLVYDDQGNIIGFQVDPNKYDAWVVDNGQNIIDWHEMAAAFSDKKNETALTLSEDFFQPGTDRFDEAFKDITSKLRTEGGTRFFDNSALYHVHGEYQFRPNWMDRITVGANGRIYTPQSRGTVFSDTADVKITNREMGFYTGAEKSLFDNKVKLTAAARVDKNENFKLLFSPAGSVVYTPTKNNYLRASFSSAIRNPTLADQYLNLNVGRATLAGNLEGATDLVTVESLLEFFEVADQSVLDSFDISPVQPEKVQTIEIGYRTTLFKNLYLDAGYYYSVYENFLGFKIGVDFEYDFNTFVTRKLDVFRYAANSENKVTTQGFSLGFNYFLPKNLAINGNYSYNQLLKTDSEDPIIPAFNTPAHKFNLGVGGRDLNIVVGNTKIRNFGFNINYKWIEGFLFEGSPQFTGLIPSYDLLDAQINYRFKKLHTTLKVGATNMLNNKNFQTYGGPRIGRLGYIQLTYDVQ